MILKKHCPHCKTKVQVSREEKEDTQTIIYFSCGHTASQRIVKPDDFLAITSRTGKKLYPYQREGIAFAVNAGGNALIADEQGVGKTVQGIIAMRALFPKQSILIVCKAGLRMQWMKEIFEWTSQHAQIIEGERDHNLNMPWGIISIDTLTPVIYSKSYTNKENKVIKKGIQNPAEFVKRFKFAGIILDECQAIKNHEAGRTNAFRALISALENVPVLPLSGTPIKNHAGEYFPILNILHPEKFPSLQGFYNNWTDSYWNGYAMKTGGLRDANKFKDFTKDFIIRRTLKEVNPDLPPIRRNPRFSELGKQVQKSYDALMNQFVDYYNGNADAGNALARQSNILAFMAQMRHLTGLAKIKPTVAFVEEFLIETDRKIIIFLHHNDVATLLKDDLTQLTNSWPIEYGEPPLTLESKHSATERSAIVEQFQTGKSRILIASTLAAGEGVDGLQRICSDIVILERQWNPANEAQVEGRIRRVGQEGNSLNATYTIATGTIDEYLSEIVERKRGYVANTLDGLPSQEVFNESSIIKELAEALAASGGKRWTL